ncbi:hypothetical protein E2562_001818 [Oryza meyeriana var. granulata]|uniref:Uncharacterized protein n=1 Tax=Oryza meyeriana var. granulata TaxID=110450 RepID=A0A6G1CEY5_9ORYZ|nr:hypothetical protein E2562_001818 [Oryza meyeriana var. granulata]
MGSVVSSAYAALCSFVNAQIDKAEVRRTTASFPHLPADAEDREEQQRYCLTDPKEEEEEEGDDDVGWWAWLMGAQQQRRPETADEYAARLPAKVGIICKYRPPCYRIDANNKRW